LRDFYYARFDGAPLSALQAFAAALVLLALTALVVVAVRANVSLRRRRAKMTPEELVEADDENLREMWLW
jgi:hypothetical protein